VIVIDMTLRCGSTLLCQMLNKLPGTRVLSEPYVFYNLMQFLSSRELSKERCEDLAAACLKLSCKPSKKVWKHDISDVLF